MVGWLLSFPLKYFLWIKKSGHIEWITNWRRHAILKLIQFMILLLLFLLEMSLSRKCHKNECLLGVQLKLHVVKSLMNAFKSSRIEYGRNFFFFPSEKWKLRVRWISVERSDTKHWVRFHDVDRPKNIQKYTKSKLKSPKWNTRTQFLCTFFNQIRRFYFWWVCHHPFFHKISSLKTLNCVQCSIIFWSGAFFPSACLFYFIKFHTTSCFNQQYSFHFDIFFVLHLFTLLFVFE